MSYALPQRRTALLFWPIKLLWRLVTFIANLTGILLAILFGLTLMVVGVALAFTLIGAIFGIPVFIFGLLLLIRGLY